ncbi:MAG: FkbM family methyltransferase [Candidatus Acidiferrales bacterium]
MATHESEPFLRKTWGEKFTSVKFRIRQGLSKIPYLPVPVRLQISPAEEIKFWWSYVSPFHHPRRGFLDYWGQDLGELRFLWRVLQPGMVFLDVGSYHGIYSLIAAKRLGKEGQIVAFEPSTREFRRLLLHLRWNGVACVHSEACAVGSSAAQRTFFQVISGDATRGGLRPPASDDSVAEVQVRSVCLDSYIASFPLHRVDVVKLDVEGGEIEALRGAASMLENMRPMLICEVLDATTQVWGYEAREIIEYLRARGYAWFDFQEDGTITPHIIQDYYPHVRNFLAVPEEKRESALRWIQR